MSQRNKVVEIASFHSRNQHLADFNSFNKRLRPSNNHPRYQDLVRGADALMRGPEPCEILGWPSPIRLSSRRSALV